MATGARGRIAGIAALLLLAIAAALLVRSGDGRDAPAGRASGARPPPGAADAPSAGVAVAGDPAAADGIDPAAAAPPLPPAVDLEAADRERDLHGVVVDGAGAPVAGAALTVERTRPGRGWDDEPDLAPQPEPLTALSARDGSFRFPLDWGEQADLRVRADGFGEGVLWGCPAGARLRVELSRVGGGLEVVVQDGAGAPVADALVTIGGGRLATRLMTSSRGRTGGDGRFVADGLAAGRASVHAAHPGFGDASEVDTSVPAAGRFRVEFVLDRGRVVEGRVLDAETGRPVAGARVGRNWTLHRPVTTDAEGRFAFRGWNQVPGHEFGGLHCLAAGYARAEVEVPAEGPVEFRLGRGFSAGGRVLGHDGRAVEGAVLTLRGLREARAGIPRTESDTRRAATGPDGRWTQRDLRRDLRYEVSVRAAGRAGMAFPVEAPRGEGDRVDAGDWVLPEGRRVEGVVLDAAGLPARDLEVCLSGGPDARVDDRGRFRIADAAPGETTIAVCRPDAYPLLEEKLTVPAGSDLRGLVLRLPAFGRIRVRVVDPGGRPLSGVEVYAYGAEDTDWVETGDDGLAVLDQIKDEVVEVAAELNGPGNRARRLPCSIEDVRPSGQELTLVLEEGVAITGVVRGADGAPAHRADVWAVVDGDEDEWFHASAGERGEFDLLVRTGRYFDLRAQRTDRDRRVIEKGVVRQVAGPKSGVEIRLEPVPPEPEPPAPR